MRSSTRRTNWVLGFIESNKPGGYIVPRACAHLLLMAVSLVAPLSGCSRPVRPGALVVTQSPVSSISSSPAQDVLELRYPLGSRIVLAEAPLDPTHFRILSAGLIAAGGLNVSYDGRRVIFCGKKLRNSEWQIYEVDCSSPAAPVAITSMAAGTMQPALLADDSVVFASPVPKLGAVDSNRIQIPQLYVQRSGATPRQLTFVPSGASDPSVLSDGRILFVSHLPSASSEMNTGLYTINNDGTELTAFAGHQEAWLKIEQPRQLADGRVAFLLQNAGASSAASTSMVFVRSARPFFGWEKLFPNTNWRVISVQPASNGDLLACVEGFQEAPSAPCSSAVFRVPRDLSGKARFAFYLEKQPADGEPTVTILNTPNWKSLEAAEAMPHARPMGRLSSTDPGQRTGQILCLNVNHTTVDQETGGVAARATAIRVAARDASGTIRTLGEVPVQSDGSFMAEVPADLPLGFEALDAKGEVLRRVRPIVWVRPGEKRSCIGCHEPHNHAPHNYRPLAVRVPVPYLGVESKKAAEMSSK